MLSAPANRDSGALTTTFTASQWLLLTLPDPFKIAGELTSFCEHVAGRPVAYILDRDQGFDLVGHAVERWGRGTEEDRMTSAQNEGEGSVGVFLASATTLLIATPTSKEA